MHDLDPACTAWKENERKNSQHVVQSFGTEVVRLCKCVFLQRLLQKLHSAGQVCTHALHSLCLSTMNYVLIIEILENMFQTACRVLLAESKISSLSTQHVSKKKKHSKCQTGNSGFMKTEKNLAMRFTQRWTGELMCIGFSKHPFITCFKSTGHQFIDVTSIFASPFPHTCAAGSPVSVYKQSGSRYRTPQLFWLPLPMQRVQSACWSQQTKVSGLHSFSSLAFCPRVQVV